jgi:hypothetical protein
MEKRKILTICFLALALVLCLDEVSKAVAWLEIAKLLASDGAANDVFGLSVSISGDYAIVGAGYDDDFKGSAYIFKRDGFFWKEQAKLVASDGAAEDLFGWPVSISGDYAIVGAMGDDDIKGSAYIFKREGTSWKQEAKLVALDGAAHDQFGWPVSISGDYTIIGADNDDDKGNCSGSAYIFKRDGTSWSQEAKLVASDGEEWDFFGNSVSISGDSAIVGANCDDVNGYDSGSAYIFRREGTSWKQEAKIVASDGVAGDNFGDPVSIIGDLAIVGAFWDDDMGYHSGSAYIFRRDGTSWSQEAKLLVLCKD